MVVGDIGRMGVTMMLMQQDDQDGHDDDTNGFDLFDVCLITWNNEWDGWEVFGDGCRGCGPEWPLHRRDCRRPRTSHAMMTTMTMMVMVK